MHVQIYTWSTCSFCAQARDLLDEHDVSWSEQSLDGDRAAAERLTDWFGRAVMPYVVVDGEPLGGLEELRAWLAQGE